MNRRSFVAGSAVAFSMLTGMLGSRAAQSEPEQSFDSNAVRKLAQELARKPYKERDTTLPDAFGNIDYDNYRSIRFRPEQAVWRSEKLPFQLQFFHRGWIFKDRVEIYLVKRGRAQRVVYSPDLFDFGEAKPPPGDANLGFAGFRIHAKINRPDYFDEVGAFLGASYFRAVAKGQVYGMSARGLSVRTADQKGEEFPAFTTFWIEQPAPDSNSIVVHALLDSPSAAAAFRFTIRPGETTIYDTELALYPRADLSQAGIATGTSMFLFDANDRVGVDDFRSAVHDSDGLAMRSGRNEEIWRPLNNPRDLQVSYFDDVNPRGFGLMQRERDFFAYDDLESHFEMRPSLWAEPIGDWGEGQVQLVEIPTKEEIHDNIVTFWRPKEPLKARSEYFYTYRLHWSHSQPNSNRLARFAKTNVGLGNNGARRFVVEAVGGALSSEQGAVTPNVSASKGEIRNLVLQWNPQTGGMRLGFELDPKGEKLVELRAQLTNSNNPVSETWLYRWTP